MGCIVSYLSYLFLLLFTSFLLRNKRGVSGGWHRGRCSRLGKKPRRRKSSGPAHPRAAQLKKLLRELKRLSLKRVPESRKNRYPFIHEVIHQFASDRKS